MAKTASSYTSRKPDPAGYVRYSTNEHAVWRDLYLRQMEVIHDRACPEFLQGISRLQLDPYTVPQIPDINARLKAYTGWAVEPVPALISFDRFFTLLSEKKFPAATFIRRREDFDYIQEPDIFHEIFGHCPMLTHPFFADFTEHYGKIGLQATAKEKVFLARLYWFTIEFGLVQTSKGLRIYGGGVLSSFGETKYALESPKPLRKRFNLLDILRTPYRIDCYQAVYFVLDHYQTLFDLINKDILASVKQAKDIGLHVPGIDMPRQC